jgi:hypothetical protein
MIVLGMYIVGVLVDLFVFEDPSDIRYLLLVVVWLVGTKMYRYSSRMTFMVCLGLVGVMFVFFVGDPESKIAERAAVWLYLMMLVGLLQQVWELRKTSEKKV